MADHVVVDAPAMVLAVVGEAPTRRAARRALVGVGRHAPHLIDAECEVRGNLSFYDALYVALAEALDCPLVTADRRITGAPGLRCELQVIAA